MPLTDSAGAAATVSLAMMVLVCGAGVLLVILVAIPPQPARRLAALLPRESAFPREAATSASGRRLGGRLGGRLKPLVRSLGLRKGAATQRSAAVVELCRALEAELRAGQPPGMALAAAVDELAAPWLAELAPVRNSAASGHDPVPSLREAALRPGAGGLAHLAACWTLVTTSGGSLAAAVTRLGEGLASVEEQHRELRAQLAGPRATAVLVALLPLLGMALAAAIGAQPLSFLLTTPLGLACLAAGVGLDLLGLYWTRRMVGRALGASERTETSVAGTR